MTEVRGADQFVALARRLKEAGEVDLNRELYKGINDATLLLKEELAASALNTLPHRGGLGRVISESRITISKRSVGKTAGIRVKASSGHDIGAIDRGRVRHPLFGDKSHWYEQAVKPGWWSTPTGRSGLAARRGVDQAMENIKQKIEGR